jgi:hypothetical protein
MLPHVSSRQREILVRRLLRFLDETVQKNHLLFSVYIEQHASDTVLRKVRADLVSAIPKRPANRHAQRPAEFNGHNIGSNTFAISVVRQRLEPLPYRLSASVSAKEDDCDALAFRQSCARCRLFSHRS